MPTVPFASPRAQAAAAVDPTFLAIAGREFIDYAKTLPQYDTGDENTVDPEAKGMERLTRDHNEYNPQDIQRDRTDPAKDYQPRGA